MKQSDSLKAFTVAAAAVLTAGSAFAQDQHTPLTDCMITNGEISVNIDGIRGVGVDSSGVFVDLYGSNPNHRFDTGGLRISGSALGLPTSGVALDDGGTEVFKHASWGTLHDTSSPSSPSRDLITPEQVAESTGLTGLTSYIDYATSTVQEFDYSLLCEGDDKAISVWDIGIEDGLFEDRLLGDPYIPKAEQKLLDDAGRALSAIQGRANGLTPGSSN